MAKGRTTSLTICLTPAERQLLLEQQRAIHLRAVLARRARIILLIAERMPIVHVAVRVGISRRHVYKWAQRFLVYGIAGLADNPGRGSRRTPRLGDGQRVAHP